MALFSLFNNVNEEFKKRWLSDEGFIISHKLIIIFTYDVHTKTVEVQDIKVSELDFGSDINMPKFLELFIRTATNEYLSSPENKKETEERILETILELEKEGQVVFDW